MREELERFHLITPSDTDAVPKTTQFESAEKFLQWMQQEVESEMVGNSDSRLDTFLEFLEKREEECGES